MLNSVKPCIFIIKNLQMRPDTVLDNKSMKLSIEEIGRSRGRPSIFFQGQFHGSSVINPIVFVCKLK